MLAPPAPHNLHMLDKDKAPAVVNRTFQTARAVRLFALLALFLAAAVASLLAKEFVMPRAENARAYAAHDYHPSEHVAVGVDAYIGDKGSIFKTRFAENEIIPIFVVISNSGDQPVELSRVKFELVAVDRRARIEPATEDDLFRRLSQTKRRGDEASRNPLPIPLPRGGPKIGVKKETRQEIDAAQFRARAVDAHSTESGFLFFDVSGVRDPLAGGKLYVTGVRDSDGQELMFFEVPLDKAGNR
ncbi:MAG TPA: hypothetical protein VD837_03980 [Terriglobales bacterium]|nr:hypothetical protein [Terriglobales bacterium]